MNFSFITWGLLLIFNIFCCNYTAIAADSNQVHIVQPGETMSHLSDKYNVKIKDILEANGNLDQSKVRVGQKINIPINKSLSAAKSSVKQDKTQPVVQTISTKPEGKTSNHPAEKPIVQSNSDSHIVKPGESLSVLADRYKIFKKDIMTLNGMSSETLKVGQKIKIPGANSPSKTSETSKDLTIKTAQPPVVSDDLPSSDSDALTATTKPEIVPSSKNSGNKKTFPYPARNRSYSTVDNGKGVKFTNDTEKMAEALSASPGVVLYVGNSVSTLKTLVIVKHDPQYTLLYGNIADVKVKKGDSIKVGDLIGYYNAEMSFFIRKNGEFDDPAKYLD